MRLGLLLIAALMVPAPADADPLVYGNNLVYQGAIKVPGGTFGGSTLSYGGQAITFNPANNSLFISGHDQHQKIAEISLPSAVNNAALGLPPPIPSTSLPMLNTATVIQNFADPTDGNITKLAADGTTIAGTVKLGGLLKWGTGLIGTVFSFYDAGNLAKRSHYKTTTNLASTSDFSGMYTVGSLPNTPSASYVSGFMSLIPDNSGSGGTNWQTQLGGKVLTGNGTLSILARTSFGPAAFAFDPDRLGVDTPVADTPLLYYTQAHATLGPDGVVGSANTAFNATTKIAGMVMLPGTRSVLYFGYHGVGPYSYGDWTADPSAVVNGSVYYDPTGLGNKGPHAYPYIYQVWAYDADDLVAVKNGTKQPWEVVPYATWKLPFNFAYTQIFGGGAAFDPATNNLYVSEPGSLKVGSSELLPLIHVFHLDLSAAAAASYKVQGKALLLKGSLTLRNNGSDPLTISSSDRATAQDISFPASVATGGSYSVTVATQPVGQTCTVHNGTGTINANADISNIVVYCTGDGAVNPGTATTLSGTLSGTIH